MAPGGSTVEGIRRGSERRSGGSDSNRSSDEYIRSIQEGAELRREVEREGGSRAGRLDTQDPDIVERARRNVEDRMSGGSGGPSEPVATIGGQPVTSFSNAPPQASIAGNRITGFSNAPRRELVDTPRVRPPPSRGPVTFTGFQNATTPRNTGSEPSMEPSIRPAPDRTRAGRIVRAFGSGVRAGLTGRNRAGSGADAISGPDRVQRAGAVAGIIGGIALSRGTSTRAGQAVVRTARPAINAIRGYRATIAGRPLVVRTAADLGTGFALVEGSSVVGVSRLDRQTLNSPEGRAAQRRALENRRSSFGSGPSSWALTALDQVPLVGSSAVDAITGGRSRDALVRGTTVGQARAITSDFRARRVGGVLGFPLINAASEDLGRSAFSGLNRAAIIRETRRAGATATRAFSATSVPVAAGQRTGRVVGRRAFAAIAPAGALEGAASVQLDARIDRRTATPGETLVGAGVGAGVAGLAGSFIARSAVDAPRVSNAARVGLDITDPFERPGDIITDVGRSGLRSRAARRAGASGLGVEDLTVTVPSRVPSVAPSQTRIPSRSSIRSRVGVNVRAPSSVLAPSNVFTPVQPRVGTPVPSNVGTPVPSQVGTPVRSNIFTPVNVPVVTPNVPLFPSGSSRGFSIGSPRRIGGFQFRNTPSLFLVAGGRSGRVRQGTVTGLGVRGL